jgi:predicted RNase H-like HicB family nuclease
MKYHYSIIIQWSQEDQLFLVTLPEFTDVMQPCTHGKNYEEAVQNAQDLIDSLIEIYQQDNKPLPELQILQTA